MSDLNYKIKNGEAYIALPSRFLLTLFSEPPGRYAVSVFKIRVETRKIGKTYEFGYIDYFHIGSHQQVLRVS